jgi:hypothetical protein
MPLGINDTQHKATSRYAECLKLGAAFFIVVFSVVLLNVIMRSVVGTDVWAHKRNRSIRFWFYKLKTILCKFTPSCC